MTALHVPKMRVLPRTPPQRRCRGVVLVIALVLLTAISLMAASTLRNAVSTETIAGAVRTSETALQAADIALRYCESLALASIASAAPGGANSSRTKTAIEMELVPPLWQDLANWDGVSPKQRVLPLDFVNTSGAQGTYRRPPECLAERLAVAEDGEGTTPVAAGTAAVSVTVFVITARGFGPDVPALPAVGRPTGTEVWLQSQIELIHTPGAAPETLRSWRQLIMR
jgi:type IV pilus assembly protein PilX